VAVATLDAISGGGELLRMRFTSQAGTGVSALVLSDVHFNEDDPSAVPSEGKVVVRLVGDTTANGFVTALDASVILQHVAGSAELDDVALSAAEVSGDGTISALDATLVLQQVTGLVTCLPAEAGCTAAKATATDLW
jgi:hypothetical protein